MNILGDNRLVLVYWAIKKYLGHYGLSLCPLIMLKVPHYNPLCPNSPHITQYIHNGLSVLFMQNPLCPNITTMMMEVPHYQPLSPNFNVVIHFLNIALLSPAMQMCLNITHYIESSLFIICRTQEVKRLCGEILI